jgi:gliding motility-associated-like protein
LQNTSGTYHDTLQSYLGCDSALITHLTVNPSPVINLGNDTSFCEGASILLNAGTGFQNYLWQDQSAETFFVATDMGSYWVRVTNSYGCSSTDTIYVTDVYPLPNNFLPADTSICGNIPFTISVDGFQNYLWNDGDTNTFKIISVEGVYELQVKDAHDCAGTDEIVVANGCDEDILVPNAFTPNGDGLNDLFLPIIIKNLSEYHMVIFNRWGIEVFESNNLSEGWNGSDNGLPGEVGVFSWAIDYALKDGTKKIIKGTVALLR